jgi:hypothetical protein
MLPDGLADGSMGQEVIDEWHGWMGLRGVVWDGENGSIIVKGVGYRAKSGFARS